EFPLQKMIPEPTAEDVKNFLRRACQQFLEWGVTTAQDAYVFPETLRAYQELRREGQLPVRFGLMLAFIHYATGEDYSDEWVKVGLTTGFGDDWLRIIGVKFLCDGAFTGRTAAMYEPYVGEEVPEDSPMYKGILHIPPERVKELVMKAHLAGLRPCVHAQGDYGIDVVLDAMEAALEEKPVEDHRMRIEHGGLTTPRQLERMKRLGVLVSSSISFLGGDVSTNWIYWGMERMRWTYALRSLMEYGIVAGGNGDWPVTTGNPLVGIATAATRKAVTGDILDASQCISVMDAIRMYTVNGAFLAFEEDIKGSLEPGKLADMVVLNRDILAIPPDEIRDVKVDMTIVGGEVKYRRAP
ncbi:MAG: amidohydrolase, partial [Candidatus Bathyarchaeia archaeon]